MKIGFFGDSFCQYDVPEDWQNVDYETYITKLKKHYNAEIVNLGQSGSSIYDLILLQIKPFIDTNYYPDVCIFVWTDIARLFHRNHRNLNIHTIDHEKENFTIRAAKQYFAYLYDANLQKFQYKAALQYFDLNVLSTFPKTTKILHLWSFEKLYDWKHGIEVMPELVSLALEDRDFFEVTKYDPAPNHLDGDKKNTLVFNWIKEAIDTYTSSPY